MKVLVKNGATSVRQRIFIQDSSQTTGVGLTGLTNASAGLAAYYFRDGDTGATVHTLAAGTVGTWSSGGFKEIDATNLPGVYEIGIFNAVFANNVRDAVVMLKGATNMVPVIIEFQIVPWDPQDAVKLGLTNLDATVSSRATPAQILSTPANLLATDASGRVTVGSNADKTGYALTAAEHTSIQSDAATGVLITPANKLSTNASGFVTVVTNNDKAGYSLATPPPTTAQIAAAILATPANLLATSVGGGVTVTTNNDKTGYALTAGEHALINGDVWDTADTVDNPANCDTPRRQWRCVTAAVLGVTSGMGGATGTFSNIKGTKTRVTATLTTTDRSAVTLDGT